MSIFAVDFDGTLCLGDSYPNCENGKPNIKLIKYLMAARNRGHKIILWTMREGNLLDEAVFWCMDRGMAFDAINDNVPEMCDVYHNNPRKVFADFYLDDRNAVCGLGRKLPVFRKEKR